MTTNELKQYIDKTLGNSIRCLLPSYWWKRLFGLIIGKVDEVELTATTAKKRADAVAVNMTNLRKEIDDKPSGYHLYTGVVLIGSLAEKQVETVAAIREKLFTQSKNFSLIIERDGCVYKPIKVGFSKDNDDNIMVQYIHKGEFVTLVTDGVTETESREPIEGAMSMLYYPSDDILTADEIAHNKAILAAVGNHEIETKDIIVGQKRIVLGNTTYQSVSVDKITYIGLLDTSGLAIYCTLYDDLITPSTYMSRIEFRSDGEIATSVWDIDTEMSDTSVKAVQNKVITSALDNKVDKVSGKQLSTEDFTTTLKTKLESLSNYDDTQLESAINTLRSDFDKIVSGDTTTAIKTFNEVIAFLEGIADTESLDSIIASIEQQIAGKQDTISDLDTIRSGAALGATALQEHQQLKTINGQSILGSGDITIEGGGGGNVDTELSLESENAVQNKAVTKTIQDNEEVITAVFNNINEQIADFAHNVESTYLPIDTHEIEKEKVVKDIQDNEEVIAAVLNDLNEKINYLQTSIRDIYEKLESI